MAAFYKKFNGFLNFTLETIKYKLKADNFFKITWNASQTHTTNHQFSERNREAQACLASQLSIWQENARRRRSAFLALSDDDFGFADELSVKFDVGHAIKLALIHDMGEIYTGDSWSLKPDKKQKHAEEEKSMKKVLSVLPQDLQKELYNLWLEYENGETIEAKVAKALDKIIYSIQYATSQEIEWGAKNFNSWIKRIRDATY